MAITQLRMMSLIAAARDYQQAFRTACALVREAAENAESPEVRFALDVLRASINPGALEFPEQSPTTIEIEHAHFKRNAGANNRAMLRMRRERGASPQRAQSGRADASAMLERFESRGALERPTAPDSLLASVPAQARREAGWIAPSRGRPQRGAPKGQFIEQMNWDGAADSGGAGEAGEDFSPSLPLTREELAGDDRIARALELAAQAQAQAHAPASPALALELDDALEASGAVPGEPEAESGAA